MNGVWGSAPKITLISFGSLSNVQNKHPDRTCMNIDRAATYIKWLIEQPRDICINEISIDPLQQPYE
jgi:NADP-dependent 3-hydroxy acid dehydrogenase YdfG